MPSEPRLRVFGIGATAFSGTTLLSFMLGAHRRIFATSEAYQLFHRYRAMVGKILRPKIAVLLVYGAGFQRPAFPDHGAIAMEELIGLAGREDPAVGAEHEAEQRRAGEGGGADTEDP